MTEDNDAAIKKMAELLRQGATMLADACPQCGSPLLKVDEDIYCAVCDRRIVVVKTSEEVESVALKALIPELRETLLNKLKTLNDLIQREDDTESLTRLANLMLLLLQSLYKIEGISEG